MALRESFEASLRSLQREQRDLIIREQSAFAGKAWMANAVESSQFPQGMANIARKGALDLVQKAARECEALQDLSDAGDLEKAGKAIVAAAGRLLSVGSENMLGNALNFTANVTRGFATKELEQEIRDRLLVARDRRRAKQKDAALSWTLLVLRSQPIDASSIATDEEYREVRLAVREAEYRDQINVVPELAARICDVFRAVNEHRPRVIHFSGHGGQSCLALLDDQGQTRVFDGQNLAKLIAANKDAVELVVLNTCHSLSQAKKLLDAVPHAIGVDGKLPDKAALIFSRMFYSALAHGRSISSSFRQAQIALGAEMGVNGEALYKLLSRSSKDPDEAILVTRTPGGGNDSAQEMLSQEEQELLTSVPNTGDIYILETNCKGRWIRVEGTDLCKDDDPSVSARYMDALESLTMRGLVRHEGGVLHKLTGKGWAVKKSIQ